MKIVSIKFLNLNSLKGVHEIRFDRPPFTESGLFAITGPTGAGKTTILDAITVALYGRVHRHSNDDPSEIMTRHTGESFSEVEFEVKNMVYRSKWSNYRAHKKANAKLQGVKMELSNATTNEIIESHHLSKVQSKIVELCGLDYQQFLRSVILSQGDFTRFLKANENERSELLEKLTDTGIYSEISMFTFSKTREEKTKLEILQSRLNDVTLLSEEEIASFKGSLLEISNDESVRVREKNDFEHQLSWLQNLSNLRSRKQQLQNNYELFISNLQLQQPLFQKLKLHTQALKHLPLLTESEKASKQVSDASKKLAEIDLQIPVLAEAVTSLSQKAREAEVGYQNAEQEQNEVEPIIIETEKKDVLIIGKSEDCSEIKKDYDQLTVEIQETDAKSAKQEKDLQVLKEQVDESKQWLANHVSDSNLEKVIPVFIGYMERLDELYKKVKALNGEKNKFEQEHPAEDKKRQLLQQKSERIKSQLDSTIEHLTLNEEGLIVVLEGKSLEGWESEAESLPALISVCEQQFGIANRIIEYHKSLRDFELKEEHISQQLEDESVLFQQLKSQLKEAEELFSALQKNFELQLLVQKYEADRKKLQLNQECPLCGSTHHPFVQNNYMGELSEAEEKRNVQKIKLDKLFKALNYKDVLIRTLADHREQLGIQKTGFNEELSLLVETFENNNAKLPKALDQEKPEIVAAVIAKKYKQLSTLKEKIREIRNVGKKISENESAISKLKEEDLKVGGEINQSKIKSDNLQASIARINDELTAISITEKELINKSFQLLDAYNIVFDYTKIKNILKEVEFRSKRFVQTQKDVQEKEIVVSKTDSDLKHLKEINEEKIQRLQKISDQLEIALAVLHQLKEERFDLFGEKSTKSERERLQNQLTQTKKVFEGLRNELVVKEQKLGIAINEQRHVNEELEQLQESKDQLGRKLSEQLLLDNIESVANLRQRLLGEKEADEILQRQQQSEKEKTELEQSLKDVETQLGIELQKELTSEREEVLTAQIEAAKENIKQLNQQIGRINEILKGDELRKEQYAELGLQIDLQKKEFDRWNKLCLLIGSENGKKFSRFAQGLTLARLTELANRHLLRLSDRYKILKTAEKDLELQIVDGYQADAIRPMATLSGGESFLVSLALALGLSDLASRKVQINSLFIDEGFGTLDPDTLDVAVTALENLQANGKSIGIISHVEALKDRIGTQIQVSKQPGGHSKIKVVSYAREFSY